MPEVDVAVGVGRAVVQHEAGATFLGALLPVVEGCELVRLDHLPVPVDPGLALNPGGEGRGREKDRGAVGGLRRLPERGKRPVQRFLLTAEVLQKRFSYFAQALTAVARCLLTDHMVDQV